MSSSWGNNIRISIFGESHGPSIGIVLDGIPAGIALDMEQVYAYMARRAPGKNRFSTPRKEADIPVIQSGFLNGYTTGTPLCAMIPNTNTRSNDYQAMQTLARPGHADFTGYARYQGFNDIRGGGHFSGRLTAPLVFAGAVAVQALAQQSIIVGAHIASIHGVEDIAPDSLLLTPSSLLSIQAKDFPVFSDKQGEKMMAEIDAARKEEDSVGGIIGCYALNVPSGLGSPMFDGLENRIASLVFGIPAVRGLEFGTGFLASQMRGSEHNDPLYIQDDRIKSTTNHHGGILGGISSGMPISLRVAMKPTSSIAHPQRTVDYKNKKDASISVQGRHDPCIVQRAVVCVESCVALTLWDALIEGGRFAWI